MTTQELKQLLASMSLEEKLGQMTQLSPDFFHIDSTMDLTGPLKSLNLTPEAVSNAGSTLNMFGADRIKQLQQRYMANHPHGIPLLFMADVIHGFRTIFPIPLAIGCSFNPSVCEKSAEVAAKESASSGIHLTFAPMADLVRDPRWGRVMESPGEDPLLNSRMTAAAVHGFQGDNPRAEGRIAACVKHFAGYGAAEGGRDYNTVDISSGTFREYYLPAYRAAVDAGVKMVMTSFNIVDRIPAGANKDLFRKILRNEWGFDGVVISDYAAVDETIAHGLSKDGAEAAKNYIEAGCDIEMMSAHYMNYAKQLIDDGKLDIKLIDEAVMNILTLKNDLGLFENPFKDADPEREKAICLCDEHRDIARAIAQECIVLLKNDNALPLSQASGMKIGLAGPFAKSINLLGGWVMPGQHATTLYDAIAQKAPDCTIISAMDSELGAMQNGIFDVDDNIDAACEALAGCDVIIAAVGENPTDTGEAASRTRLRLSHNQERMIERLSALGKPLVMVIMSGRPLEIEPVMPYADAVVQGWFLGSEAGNALADVLFGDYNPTARLSISFPRTVGQIPVYYNHYNTGRPHMGKKERYLSRYLDCPNEPLFCFGHGLSYSQFEYSALKATVCTNGAGESEIHAEVTVQNTSERHGRETVQLYVHDICGNVVRPVKELKDFRQVELAPHEAKQVTFVITKSQLSFHNADCVYAFEGGEFDIMIGHSSEEYLSQRVTLE